MSDNVFSESLVATKDRDSAKSASIFGGMKSGIYYTYILKCSDGTLYTGWTNDIGARIATHNSGRGAKYTRSRRPVQLVYLHQFPTRSDAARHEYAIKQLTRKQKEALIESQNASQHAAKDIFPV